jgi:hypothetical protein
MICDDCKSFWLTAAKTKAVYLSDTDASVIWTQHVSKLRCTAGAIKSKLATISPRCSICVCIWFSLTVSERSRIPVSALCELELHLDKEQNRPSFRARFVDYNDQDVVPSRMIAMYDKESDDGMTEASTSDHL